MLIIGVFMNFCSVWVCLSNLVSFIVCMVFRMRLILRRCGC